MMADPSKDPRDAGSPARVLPQSRQLAERLQVRSAERPIIFLSAFGRAKVILAGVVTFSLGRRRCAAGLRGGCGTPRWLVHNHVGTP